jgi:hypothetical protein
MRCERCGEKGCEECCSSAARKLAPFERQLARREKELEAELTQVRTNLKLAREFLARPGAQEELLREALRTVYDHHLLGCHGCCCGDFKATRALLED